MKKTFIYITMLAIICVAAGACKKFLDYTPRGTVSSDQLNTPERIEEMVVAAYSQLGNDHFQAPFESLWPYGNVRSGDAYKGGGSLTDNAGYGRYETFTFATTDQVEADRLWYRVYVGISRANDALARLNAISAQAMPKKTERQAEMRFLRGHLYFILKIMFKHIPYFDETVPADSVALRSNRQFSSDEVWDKIAGEFRFAADHLPATQADKGRPSKFAAKAYLAKTLLYQAYRQNDQHQVTSIDAAKLTEVVDLVTEVDGAYALTSDFAENFLWDYDNSNRETIWTIQRSINDGTPNGRVDMGNALNYPMNYGCCGFHMPSQNLVNAFKTDADGLPQFDTFNQTEMKDSIDFRTNSVDPRLDHTVGIPTHPWKYQTNYIYTISYARAPQIYFRYSSMKEAQVQNCSCLRKVGNFYGSSKNTTIIRLADALLWKAEALIELNRKDEALPIINRVRTRAGASTSRLKYASGQAVANYKIGQYTSTQWTQEFARKALRWERRLELAMEGTRFFDLVRWGIAAQYINDYFLVEKTRRSYLSDAKFTAAKDEYLPIPQQQINFTKGLYQQNIGW